MQPPEAVHRHSPVRAAFLADELRHAGSNQARAASHQGLRAFWSRRRRPLSWAAGLLTIALACWAAIDLVSPNNVPVFARLGSSLPASDAVLALTVLSVFAGALVSGLAGFAFSAIAGAILFHWLAPTQAVPLLLACSITTQVVSIRKLSGTMQWRKCMPYLAGGFAGIPIGEKLLVGLNPHLFAAAFGAFLVCYSAYMLLRPGLAIQGGGTLVDVLAGFAGGITGGSTAFPGAVPTVWCSLRNMPKNEQRGVVQPFIFVMQIATLIYFSKLGIVSVSSLGLYLLCAPAVLCGTCLGLHLFNRIDDAMFRRIVLIFLLVCGAALAI